ncbi:MAG: CDP-archaeol synthase [Candidatus Levybacteria bacterium]|nr:CDP-archaeol synthase [Candidatus Levybacteria bacterium]
MVEQLLKDLFFAFWFFGPAGLANVLAFGSGKAKMLRQFSYPVDCYLKFRGKRILGSHKTVRGFVVGTIAAILAVNLQIFLYQNLAWMRAVLPIDYNVVNPIILGFLLGFGALAGDAIKSFFKRQAGIQPGVSWVPFDQIDFILGGIIFSWFYLQLTLVQYMLILFMWIIIHPLISFLGYVLKLKRKPI